MSDRERLTKAERREIARRERREKEQAEAKAQTRRRILSAVTAVAAIAGVAALFWFTRETDPVVGEITISESAAEQALQAAGCETVPATTTGNAEHLSEPAPPAEQLYQNLPTASGPHLPIVSPVGAFDDPLDERITTHNLEHGAIVVWHEPGYAEAGAIRDWVEDRNDAGFSRESGAGLIAAPYERGIAPGKNVALRAWGQAVNCAEFDQTVADAFVIRYFGSHGQAPEAFFGEYPEGVLTFEGGGEGEPEPAPTATDEPATGEGTVPPPTEPASPSGEETASPSPS